MLGPFSPLSRQLGFDCKIQQHADYKIGGADARSSGIPAFLAAALFFSLHFPSFSGFYCPSTISHTL
ncbi:unnamed protein product [Hymenolepis diminuta]|uniref:Uncharacterized protein n=1 Tax=Hymenolepis diminuta TaxID=6216 RepID=A0A564XXS4_HYMDI|nr:unnamed protein product [Hymenolepis diminuta]